MPVDSPPRKPSAAMTRVTFAAALFVAGAVSWVAHAEGLREIQAKSLQLGDASGVAYYTVQGQGYRLVVTLAGQDSTPGRFETTLLPGQKVTMSMPGSPRANARTIGGPPPGDEESQNGRLGLARSPSKPVIFDDELERRWKGKRNVARTQR